MNKRQCNSANFQASIHGIKLKDSGTPTDSSLKLTEEQDSKLMESLSKRVNSGKRV